jgi:cell division septal protein FtsQ
MGDTIAMAKKKQKWTPNPQNAPTKKRVSAGVDRIYQANIILFTITCLCGVAMLPILYAGKRTSAWLDVRHVRVVGLDNSLVTQDERAKVLQIVRLPAHSNVYSVPKAAIEKQLRALPYVQAASINHVLYPSVTVTADLRLRQPAVLVKTSNGTFEADQNCVAIRPAIEGKHYTLPEVTFTNELQVSIGKVIPGEVLKAAIALTRDFPAIVARPLLSIEVDRDSKLWLNVDHGLRINFGSEVNTPAKLATVKQILDLDPDHGSTFAEVNVTAPDFPCCRLKSEVAKYAALAAQASKSANLLNPQQTGAPAALTPVSTSAPPAQHLQ